MAYRGLSDFVERIDNEGELLRVSEAVSPHLEITEITDRIVKGDGRAILFENTSTDFPLLINAFGSDRRIALALSRSDLDDAGREIEELFKMLTGGSRGSLLSKIVSLPRLIGYSRLMPARSRRRGRCQQIVMDEPRLDRLPVMQCWPHDGGPFITLPAVHTFHPVTGAKNVGMYRMQVYDNKTTGMHWHRHKTGARHYEAWKKIGGKMPVAVTLGGDPVYTYAATAPLPENIDEYILAGFLRKKRVTMVKCLTQDIWVPSDADIVIEGYVDTAEELRTEGPFGDHTGVYSLADNYPIFHVTAITYARNAIYPSTIVGVPPQEDAWIGEATERLFLAPIKLTLAPEVTDLHMPVAGVAHNLVIVKIDKSFPGQGMKVLNSLYGAGQMMFSKFIVVVSGDIDIRDYDAVMAAISNNCRFDEDILFTRGPLDVLDHSSDRFSFGGKAGIDATEKHPEEASGNSDYALAKVDKLQKIGESLAGRRAQYIKGWYVPFDGVLLLEVDTTSMSPGTRSEIKRQLLSENTPERCLIVLLENGTPMEDGVVVMWQITGNTDPVRDMITQEAKIIIDATFKRPGIGCFPRSWPEVVVSDSQTIERIDKEWKSLTGLELIPSPSMKVVDLVKGDGAELTDHSN